MARILIGNVKGPKGDTGLQGIQGEIGPAGPQGPLPPLVNNALATTAGVAALDAVMGKTLQDQITEQNSNLTRKQLIATEGTTEADIKNFISSSISNGQLSFSIVTILNSANTAFFGENGNFTILVAGDSANYGFFATNLWNGKLWTGRFATYQDDWSLVVHA